MGGSSREGNAENVLNEAHGDDVVVANDVLLDAHKEDDAIAMGWCSSRWGQDAGKNEFLGAPKDDVDVAIGLRLIRNKLVSLVRVQHLSGSGFVNEQLHSGTAVMRNIEAGEVQDKGN